MRRAFARYFNRSPDKLGPEQMRAYLLHLRQERQASTSYYNQIRCALRFFYGVTLGRDDVPASIVPARQPHTLPVVLSADEVARFFAAIGNLAQTQHSCHQGQTESLTFRRIGKGRSKGGQIWGQGARNDLNLRVIS